MTHRDPGLAGAVLASEEVAAELICDGHHVHPAVDARSRLPPRARRASWRSPTARPAPVCRRLARARSAVRPITVGDVARLDDGTMAGSVATMDRVFACLVTALRPRPRATPRRCAPRRRRASWASSDTASSPRAPPPIWSCSTRNLRVGPDLDWRGGSAWSRNLGPPGTVLNSMTSRVLPCVCLSARGHLGRAGLRDQRRRRGLHRARGKAVSGRNHGRTAPLHVRRRGRGPVLGPARGRRRRSRSAARTRTRSRRSRCSRSGTGQRIQVEARHPGGRRTFVGLGSFRSPSAQFIANVPRKTNLVVRTGDGARRSSSASTGTAGTAHERRLDSRCRDGRRAARGNRRRQHPARRRLRPRRGAHGRRQRAHHRHAGALRARSGDGSIVLRIRSGADHDRRLDGRDGAMAPSRSSCRTASTPRSKPIPAPMAARAAS